VIPSAQVIGIITGTIFLFSGLAVCAIAIMRSRSGTRVLMWVGLWSALYGLRPVIDPLGRAGLLPHWLEAARPFVDMIPRYLVLVVASLAGMELSRGKLRALYQGLGLVALAVGVAGIVNFIVSGSNGEFLLYNQILTTSLLVILLTVLLVPTLSDRFLVLPSSNHKVLAIGALVFVVEALYVNVVRPLGYHPNSQWDSFGFAVLLLSLGYVAVDMMLTNEHRLLTIDKELAIAREIQNSILPAGTPELQNLRIAAAYRPMTEVAGDFYEFVPIDKNRMGFLVADASGHGVPAALIAAMIKVAVQSIVPCAANPSEVLHELNRILCGQLRDQFVTAAYLLIDSASGNALYSAAGHPPLLRWRDGKLEQIESNGIVFGIEPDPQYPICKMTLRCGDRFLLYTDGVIEAENPRGKAFGDAKLEEVIRENQSRNGAHLVKQLLDEIACWRAPVMTQQDDITLLVIDVV
jgi:sigma-B regulation protein RsbU (phosphoserine phosphatase)